MFGYIAVNKPEMKIKDYDVYQSYYCGLCKRLRECYGKRGQMTLSYDMSFLILLLGGLYEPETSKTLCSCTARPFKKHVVRINAFTDYAAAMNVLLSYYKCKDDWADDHSHKGYLAARLLHPKAVMASCRYPAKAHLMSVKLRQISRLEQKNEQSLDVISRLFGDIMAEIFAFKNDEWEKSLRRFGFFLGKFIYLMDAYEDIEDDMKSGNYNPLKKSYGQDDFEQQSRQLLTMMIAECSREFEKLPVITNAEILRNILYSGVWCRFEAVTAKRRTRKGAAGQEKDHDGSI